MDIKRILRGGCRYLLDSDYRFLFNSYRGIYDKMSDEKFLCRSFKAILGRKLDLQQPQTFNEKLQWLKLYDRRPEYTMMVDKFAVREYIAEKLGEEYLIPLIGVWDDPDEIDFDALPDQFVLKCNHNSGLGMCICKDKSKLDREKVKKELRKGLKEDFYLRTREWPYKDVPRKIVCEKYMVDESGYELKDYKIFCFNGAPKIMFVASDRNLGDDHTKFDFFDMNFDHLPLVNGHPNTDKEIQKPRSLEQMIEFAGKLSEGIPFVRIDFYDINGKPYFGEMTFFHYSGMVPFEPEEWDYKLGSWITLPPKYI